MIFEGNAWHDLLFDELARNLYIEDAVEMIFIFQVMSKPLGSICNLEIFYPWSPLCMASVKPW